ncbi:MAG: hypothetical protein Kow0098_21220 [Ignavibacteriaceae bacterium]
MYNLFYIIFYSLMQVIYSESVLKPEIIQYRFNDINELIRMDMSNLRDTVYTLNEYYVEVNLTTQKAILHSRNSPGLQFGISSGTKKIEDGMETKPGLFVVQSMMPEWYSQQFDSTLMLKWIGFNYGIGFHALQSNGYYKYLGVKPSSHGCLRVSREDANLLYDLLKPGSPVLVHNGNNAIVVAFADSNRIYTRTGFSEFRSLMKRRLEELYAGIYFLSPKPKLLIDRSNIPHSGIDIGDSGLIPKRQLIEPVHLYISAVIPARRDAERIEYSVFSESPFRFVVGK